MTARRRTGAGVPVLLVPPAAIGAAFLLLPTIALLIRMPWLVITAEGAFRVADRGLEEAAATLGASRLAVFWRVTLPGIGPSLVAGTVLCWARALGEFGATITFNGSLAGQTEVMPIAIS